MNRVRHILRALVGGLAEFVWSPAPLWLPGGAFRWPGQPPPR
jgi:hypothetical protein